MLTITQVHSVIIIGAIPLSSPDSFGFSTKDRRPFLRSEEMRNEIYAYMAGILKNLECHPIKIGGVKDHVHIFRKRFVSC